MQMRLFEVILVVFPTANAWAATYQVFPADGARATQVAVDKAKSGDTVVIHAGTYRESVRVANDGTPEKPIIIAGAPGEEVILTGADAIPSGQWVLLPDTSIWRHAPWPYRGPTHPNNEFHRLIGRTEQVIVDGKLLRQVLEMKQMEPGTFYAEPAKALFVRLPGDGAPAEHRIEASVRPVLMEITGNHVVVRHLRFVHASNSAQRPALDIAGAGNLVEDCVAEWTNGVGARLGGERNTARRLVSRFNGQMGMSGHGVRNVMEECRLEGNNVEVSPADLELMNPDQRGWRAENNLYFAAPGGGLILWGAKWLPKHREFSDLDTFRSQHGLERGSVAADPLFADWQAGNVDLHPRSPATKLGAGFTEAPR
jgi:hypothetical protein